jgi:hypothetical protein
MFCSATVCQHVTIDQYLVITSGVLAVGTTITFAIAHSAWLTIFHDRPGSAAVIADGKKTMPNMRGCPHVSGARRGEKYEPVDHPKSSAPWWYIAAPGILLSLIIASTVFNYVPPKYTSSGIAVLVRQNNPTVPNTINPIVGSDGTFTTTTLTLMQTIDTPTVKAELGLKEGADELYHQ